MLIENLFKEFIMTKEFNSWKNQIEGIEFDDGSKIVNGKVIDCFGNYLFDIPKEPIIDIEMWYEDLMEEMVDNLFN